MPHKLKWQIEKGDQMSTILKIEIKIVGKKMENQNCWFDKIETKTAF